LKRLKAERLKRDLTQVELADEVNLTQRVISVLERGFKNEHKSGFARLCDHLDLNPEEALKEVDEVEHE